MKKKVIIISVIVTFVLSIGTIIFVNRKEDKKLVEEKNNIIEKDNIKEETKIESKESNFIEESNETKENNSNDSSSTTSKDNNKTNTNNTIVTNESKTETNNNSSQVELSQEPNSPVTNNNQTTTAPKEDNVGYYDYITGGVKEFNTNSECMARGEEINTRENMIILEYNSEHMDNQKQTDITNFSCYPSGGGYFLDISCKSGNCNLKYK